jgi:hypothetical protein
MQLLDHVNVLNSGNHDPLCIAVEGVYFESK